MDAKQIVVGMDSSPAGAAALEWAVRHTRDGGTVVAASVCGMVGSNGGRDAFHGARLRILRDALARLGAHDGVLVEEAVLDGEPGPALVRLAEEADGLVLGRHGYRRGPETVMGSVIMHCLRNATCPVVIVPAVNPPIV
ncbi:universal stress protein [Saccharothrix syringae]|uniref:Universal stress protein n=1 Tax=Saccharothrix syringae TaxID=103733 RepID=A0A5Q0H8W0_SACSY|nr:universal stress protein [Saccharothrix syringae]QFZ22629.1 universal stress protein [Saccharothrix syringae]